MKIQVMMQMPDTLERSIEEAAIDAADAAKCYGQEHYDETYRKFVDEGFAVARKFFKYDELITLEIDTETKECCVIPI